MQCTCLLNCQSLNKGQKRLDRAIDALGADVMKKILGFSLYTLGYSYDYISRIIGLSEIGLKALFQDIYENGVERFLDKRKKVIFLGKQTNSKRDSQTVINYIEHEEHVEFKSNGPISIKVGKNDDMGKRVFTLLFVDNNLLTQADGAKILGCKRLSVYQNLKKINSTGIKGLLDKRKGQTKDYKFDTEIKSEIIREYLLSIFDNRIPSKTSISKYLSEKFSGKYSEGSVALHLKKLGLSDIKDELLTDLVRKVNEKINKLEYIKFGEMPLGAQYESHVKVLKKVKDELTIWGESDTTREENFFHLEKKIELLQSKLEPLLLKLAVKENKEKGITCPACHSRDTITYKKVGRQVEKKALKTSLGGRLSLSEELKYAGKCNNCGEKFDLEERVLKLSEHLKYTPLTEKKICSANRAGSYENAVKNLKELLNLDINRNEVRKISNHVGEQIIKEFKELEKDISAEVSEEEVYQRHPLIKKLEIEEKYLDKSRYLIVLAIDGGRMQLFRWIPPYNGTLKGKKRIYWHENKVFRISIYDKVNLVEISDDFNKIDNKKHYESAKMISGLTTYGATNVSWKEANGLIKSHLYIRGIQPQDIDVCISDGSEHIMREIFVPIFPKATHILDYYHKTEALNACIKSIGLGESKIEKDLKDYLWEGKIEDLIKELMKIQITVGKPSTEKRNQQDPKVKLDNFIKHLTENKERLMYNYFRKQKYPIGSGSAESAVKLFGKRIKGTEKQWNKKGGEAILNLYAFLLSEDDRWRKLWDVQTPWI
jgi:transposase